MSKRSFQANNWASGAGTADNAQATSGSYMSLDPGSASQMIKVEEIYIGGLAGATAPQNMQFRRASTLGTGGGTTLATPNSDGPLNNFAAAVTTVPAAFVAFATNQPITANTATQGKLSLPFNAYGGIVRWQAAKDEEWYMIGNAVNISSVLGNNTGSTTATLSSDIIYELA